MRRFSVVALFLAALAGFSFPARACITDSKEDLVNQQKKIFVRYDANHDGLLSPEEYDAQFRVWGVRQEGMDAKSAFEKMDKDKSGFLTFDEWSALHPPGYFPPDKNC